MNEGTIVLFGATGRVGTQVADILLAKNARIRMVGRDAAKLALFANRGIDTVVAPFADVPALTQALEGASVALTMIPSNHVSADFKGEQREALRGQVAAIKAAGVRKVVNLSSTGAHTHTGNGVLQVLAEMEDALNALPGVDVLHLRPSFYMENAFYSLGLIRHQGIYGYPTDGDHAFPMVATRDVAPVLAQYLLAPSFTGKTVQPLLGPQDYSLRQFATALGTAIDKPGLPYIRFSEEDMRGGIIGTGGSPSFADAYVELAVGFGNGLLNQERRTPETTTPTTLEAFANEIFAPVYNAQN